MIPVLILALCLWVMFRPSTWQAMVAFIIGGVMLGIIFPGIDETLGPITRSWFPE